MTKKGSVKKGNEIDKGKTPSSSRSSFDRNVKGPFHKIYMFFKTSFLNLINLAEDADKRGTVEDIREGIPMSGSNLWLLICSSIIACIGLDINSPAVIIGGMLISPLMSPILGVGLSAAIYDINMLSSSLKSLLRAAIFGLLVSVIYFYLTPFGDFTSELKARTAPTILDALVAFFGGLAGIIAGTRDIKTSALPGTAIATALMPPLCTAGFGLSTGRMEVFGGALYLFFINAVLISVSTYLIVRVLKFRKKQRLDEEITHRAKRIASVALVLLLIPSFYFLYQSAKNITQKRIVNAFISECVHKDIQKGVQWDFNKENDSLYVLRVYYFGKYIHDDSVAQLETKLREQLEENWLVNLSPNQKLSIELAPTDLPPDQEKEQINKEIAGIKSNLVILHQKQTEELELRNKLLKTSLQSADSLNTIINSAMLHEQDFIELKMEIQAIFPELDYLAIGKAQVTDFQQDGKQLITNISWKTNVAVNERIKLKKRLSDLLELKLKDDSVKIITF
jgi:uncharacterized hydrophobic protein (TIGR00271 family)